MFQDSGVHLPSFAQLFSIHHSGPRGPSRRSQPEQTDDTRWRCQSAAASTWRATSTARKAEAGVDQRQFRWIGTIVAILRSKDTTRWRPSLLGWMPFLLVTRSYLVCFLSEAMSWRIGAGKAVRWFFLRPRSSCEWTRISSKLSSPSELSLKKLSQ